ncbi:hypothetical protein FRB99_006163 [Tulasnella sp. 403]|nr:hypothetical protein FRB99_006163 [Tulasnella sp. 403]
MGIVEIITRSIPFRKYETDISLIRAKLAGEEIAPADYPELHEDDPLWSIMGRCWVRDPAERPTSKEVFAELRSLQSSLKQAQA